MSTRRTTAARGGRPPRVIGRYGGMKPGPVMLVTVGIHGNEPSGIEAARRVLRRLERDRVPIRGTLTVLVGNTRALAAGRRFLAHDLNRAWTPQRVAAARRGAPASSEAPEDREQVELLAALEDVIGEARGPLHFLDLHTSSADGAPFVAVGDTPRNRGFALNFPVPLILRLVEQIDGAVLDYMGRLGAVALGVEAGRHDQASSVERHESALWIALAASGVLREGRAKDLERHRERLRSASRGLPRAVEVRHRHPIRPGDGFRMEPGFQNFSPVRRGQILARDRDGEIRAPEDGRVLLPLYQGQGGDGFFLGRDVPVATVLHPDDA